MLAFMDDRSFADFAGALPEDVDALFRSTLTRSSGEPEELAAGYGVGYFHLVWNRDAGLSRNIVGGSGRRHRCARARRSESACALGARGDRGRALVAGGVRVRYEDAGGDRSRRCTRRCRRDARIRDTGARRAAFRRTRPRRSRRSRTGPTSSGRFSRARPADALGRDLRARDAEALVQHALQHRQRAAQRRSRRVPRAAASWSTRPPSFARRLDGLDDEAVRELFLADLHEILPQARDLVERGRDPPLGAWVCRFRRSGAARLQEALTRPLGPVHLAGDYLGTWYTETAVQSALDAALAVRRELAG